MGRETQETRGRKYIRNHPFLSLLPLDRRPNLGLWRPTTASHLREMGVECSLMPSPSLMLAYDKNIHQKYPYVKLLISIYRSL
jgi:hypothetical protein